MSAFALGGDLHPFLQRQMMIWTMLLVIALGGMIGNLMLVPPTPQSELAESPAFARHKKRLHAKEAHGPLEKAPRAPASLTPTLGDIMPVHTVDFLLDCKNANHSQLKKDVAQMRLKGSICAARDEIVSSEIRNETNGFSATVFMNDSRSFTTDYISLKRGENRIRVLHHLKSGAREEITVVATRE